MPVTDVVTKAAGLSVNVAFRLSLLVHLSAFRYIMCLIRCYLTLRVSSFVFCTTKPAFLAGCHCSYLTVTSHVTVSPLFPSSRMLIVLAKQAFFTRPAACKGHSVLPVLSQRTFDVRPETSSNRECYIDFA